MTLRSAMKWLLVVSLALPVIQAVLVWIGALLRSMGDPGGAEIIGHVGTACQAIWTVGLVGLLLLVAFATVNEKPTEE